MEKIVYMLTTIDNPWNPFTQFKRWFGEDMRKGYNTCGKIDKFARTTDEFTDDENYVILMNGMDEIIANDFTNLYMKVTENDYKNGKFQKIYDKFQKDRLESEKNQRQTVKNQSP